ncbi:MAG: hypothetical protein R3E39_14035 [Anaerolineae bacterium]
MIITAEWAYYDGFIAVLQHPWQVETVKSGRKLVRPRAAAMVAATVGKGATCGNGGGEKNGGDSGDGGNREDDRFKISDSR